MVLFLDRFIITTGETIPRPRDGHAKLPAKYVHIYFPQQPQHLSCPCAVEKKLLQRCVFSLWRPFWVFLNTCQNKGRKGESIFLMGDLRGALLAPGFDTCMKLIQLPTRRRKTQVFKKSGLMRQFVSSPFSCPSTQLPNLNWNNNFLLSCTLSHLPGKQAQSVPIDLLPPGPSRGPVLSSLVNQVLAIH